MSINSMVKSTLSELIYASLARVCGDVIACEKNNVALLYLLSDLIPKSATGGLLLYSRDGRRSL